jgi:hypothetical protein
MELESRGVFLCCQGAKSNVFPSGMLRQMSNGRLAYAHSPGVPVADTDIVDIFSHAECDGVLSIQDQREDMERLFGHAWPLMLPE